MSKRQATLNEQIVSFIATKKAENSPFTDADKDYIQQYTGGGGLIKAGATGRGVLYEFYTPVPIVEAMWALAYKHGFTSGAIIEPSCGTGRFLKYVDPTQSTVTAFEFSKDNSNSYDIARICYPWANITNYYFESIFYENGSESGKRIGKEPFADLAIGNPPYGPWDGLFAGDKLERPHYNSRTYDQYFIHACVKLLKPGGLLVFLIQGTFLTNEGGTYNEFKKALLEDCDFLEGYLLPRGTFDFSQVSPEIVVFKKK